MPSPVQEKLLELFRTSQSVNALSEKRRAEMEADLAGFSEDQAAFLIQLFLQERVEVARMRDRIAELDEQIEGLVTQVKMAGKDLNREFLKAREKESSSAEAQESEDLLAQLDEEEIPKKEAKKRKKVLGLF